jgi:hypothetical protein
MKLPNSLISPSNLGKNSNSPLRNRHRWIPTWLLAAYLGCFFLWPALQDIRAVFFAPFGLLIGYSYWFLALGLPGEVHMPLALLFVVTLFSLPWFSILASSRRATTICTLGVVLLLLTQISGFRFQRHKGRWSSIWETQVERACATQLSARESLGAERFLASILPNSNMLPLGSTEIASSASKVAISLREMSWAYGKLTGSRASEIVHACESLLLLSTEREGYSASPDRRGQVLKHGQATHACFLPSILLMS